MFKNRKFDLWTVFSIILIVLFAVFLIYPLFCILKQAFIGADGSFSIAAFVKFFSKSYYTSTLLNSLKVTLAVTAVSMLIGIPLSYFYSFYEIKGKKVIFVVSILCCMSAPFIGAYSWILLLGRSGVITTFLKNVFGINPGNIYGFKGILLVQSLKLYPLVFIYMNGAFRNIDNTLLEASANLGCSGIKRFFKIVMMLTVPTLLAAALLVFMRAFADFGTPLIIGEGYRTFPVEIYQQYLGEMGTDHSFAAAISLMAILITAAVFLFQKFATSKFKFSMNSLHPIEKKPAKGVKGVLMHAYCYIISAIAFLPQLYIIFTSFQNTNASGTVFVEGFSLMNYEKAVKKLLVRSTRNTLLIGVLALAVIIVLAIIISYLAVRRPSITNHAIDTVSMIPYIMPGSVVGIAMVTAFSSKPIVLVGTLIIMVMSVVIRRLPYTTRSATATLIQIPMSIEEAAISLGASKLKTFLKVTVPMMSNGILSGAILSWVAIVTELSSAIILYTNKTITLTLSCYIAVNRGQYGLAAAFATILTVITILSLLVYMKASKSEDNIKL